MTPPAVDTVPAGSIPWDRLTALFNHVYSDYYVHFALEEPALRQMVRRFDLDLDASRVVVGEAGPVAVAMLGIRGALGWIGGMGVAPEARRDGLGRGVMRAVIEQARRHGLEEVRLEVLEQNAPAIALYEALGFVRLRELEVWSLSTTLAGAAAREIAAAEARAWIAARRGAPEPWQRADASLDRFDAPETPLRGLEYLERGERVGAAVALVAGPRASLLQIATTGADRGRAARALCAEASAWAPTLRFLNVPADDPAAGVLRDAGALLEARQHEMSLRLAPPA